MKARRSILLALALAALLLVTGLSAFAIWWTARNSQERVAALQESHMKAGVALAAIRSNVYLNAILTRDYLLDSDSSHAQQYIDQFDKIQANTEESFRILEALGLDDEQKVALAQLRKEVAAYWDPTEVVLDWSPKKSEPSRLRPGRRLAVAQGNRRLHGLLRGVRRERTCLHQGQRCLAAERTGTAIPDREIHGPRRAGRNPSSHRRRQRRP